MTKRKFRRTVSAVKMAVAMMPLAGCETGVERWSERPGGLLDPGFSKQQESVGNPAHLEKSISIESRHFDIYTRYRAVFEEPTERFVAEQGDGGMPGATAARDEDDVSTLPTCSAHTLMAQD
ncbi:hypothetical protein GCM10027343_10730 [Noviherbaspirillum agri]